MDLWQPNCYNITFNLKKDTDFKVSDYQMPVCPKCNTIIHEPERELENQYFHVAAYTCTKCGKHFTTRQ